MELIDTHCHIHEATYPLDVADVLARAHTAGVNQMIVVGTSEQSSREAVEFARNHEHVYAAIGVHPHDTKDGYEAIATLAAQACRSAARHENGFAPGPTGAPAPGRSRVADVFLEEQRASSPLLAAIGEIGLDYFYTHSPREVQIPALEAQLQVARDYNLPVIFHVREAFDDFWPIFDNFSGLRGVLHSFTDTQAQADRALAHGLYIGVNGISTFTKDPKQQAMFDQLPLDRLLFETDAPFLTPVPFRGTVNEPALVRTVAEFHAARRRITLDEIATATTANARAIFAL